MNEPQGKEQEEKITEEDSSGRLTNKDMATLFPLRGRRNESHRQGWLEAATEMPSHNLAFVREPADSGSA